MDPSQTLDPVEPLPAAADRPRPREVREVLPMRRWACRWIETAVLAWVAGAGALADDWPQWLGPKRDGVWREAGILERFPTNGPTVLWRVPVHAGYSGPAVVGRRLYMLDRQAGPPPERKAGEPAVAQIPGDERVVCRDTRDGRILWARSYDCPYRIAYPAGPRTTPVVARGRVYSLGAMGDLRCWDAADGRLIWARQLLKDFGLSEPPVWGWAGHPLLDGDRLICLVGGTNSAVVAFDRHTGGEIWRALTATEIGYAPPMVYRVDGRRQLIIWHPDAVVGLVPETGAVLWTRKYPVEGRPQRPEVSIATPRLAGRDLFLTSFYQGSVLLRLGTGEPSVVWNRHSARNSEMTDGLHTVMATPVIKDGYIYGVCGFGELRCLDAATGDRRWETYAATGGERGFLGTAFLVEHRDRFFVWNDQGELILARLGPAGYTEVSRAKLLETVESTRGRQVLWCHPAFANRCAYMHNGRELIAVSLAAPKRGAFSRQVIH